MTLIAHRKNTISELQSTNKNYGVEVDIRSLGHNLILHHDPFEDGTLFADWIKYYAHKTLILNIKEEGLEERVLDLMYLHNIHDYFFLDQSFPFLVKFSKKGLKKTAVRLSEFESINTVLTLEGKVDWVWVDCFSFLPLSKKDYLDLKAKGFKVCIVSPELQGKDPNIEIPIYFNLLLSREIHPDAICTKNPEIWEKLQK